MPIKSPFGMLKYCLIISTSHNIRKGICICFAVTGLSNCKCISKKQENEFQPRDVICVNSAVWSQLVVIVFQSKDCKLPELCIHLSMDLKGITNKSLNGINKTKKMLKKTCSCFWRVVSGKCREVISQYSALGARDIENNLTDYNFNCY